MAPMRQIDVAGRKAHPHHGQVVRHGPQVAAWCRAGWSYSQIARELGVRFPAVYRYVKQHYPQLVDRLAGHPNHGRVVSEGEQVAAWLAAGWSQNQVARALGVNNSCVHRYVKRHAHLAALVASRAVADAPLRTDRLRRIWDYRAAGWSYSQIAREVGVHRRTVQRYVKRHPELADGRGNMHRNYGRVVSRGGQVAAWLAAGWSQNQVARALGVNDSSVHRYVKRYLQLAKHS